MKLSVQKTKLCLPKILLIYLLIQSFVGDIQAHAFVLSDSLNGVFISSRNDTSKLRALDDLFKFHLVQNYDSALKIADEIILISEMHQNTKWRAKGYTYKGVILRKKTQYDSALILYEQALCLYRNFEDDDGIANLLNKVGNIYYYKNNYSQALDYYSKSLKVATELDDAERMANGYANVGLLYAELTNYEEALHHYRRALNLSNTIENIEVAIETSSKLGNLFLTLERYDSALKYMNVALSRSIQSENTEKIAMINGNLALLYLKKNDLHKASATLRQAIEANKELNRGHHLAYNYLLLGTLHNKKGYYTESVNTFHQALLYSNKTGSLIFIRDSHDELSKAYEVIGEFQESLKHYKSYLTYKDSIFNIEKAKEFDKLRATYEFDNQQQEIESLEREKQSKNQELAEKKRSILIRNYLIGLIVLLFTVILLAVFYFKKKRAQLLSVESALTSIRLEKNQLVGVVAHDLKNTLNNIYSIIEIFRKNASNLHDKQLNYLSAMQKNVQSLRVTIINILNIDKLEDRVVNMKRVKVDMGKVFNEVLESNIFSAHEKRIDFIVDSQIECNVFGDTQCIKEIFDNLISNAIKFSPFEKNIKTSLYRKEGSVYFTIQNECNDLSLIESNQLFNRYENLSKIPSGGEASTGLGLSIAKEYIDAMGGEIVFERGNGFTLKFLLPVYHQDMVLSN